MTAINGVAERMELLPGESEKAPTVYLFPGQLYASGESAIVSTILGSCVAVCLWDSDTGVGGINHFLLPANPSRGASDARYGNIAMQRLIDMMLSRGGSVRRMVAKIVGGASVLSAYATARHSIGEQNVIVAREFLHKLDIAIAGDQTGGRRGRKLLFHTGNGSAYVKEI